MNFRKLFTEHPASRGWFPEFIYCAIFGHNYYVRSKTRELCKRCNYMHTIGI